MHLTVGSRRKPIDTNVAKKTIHYLRSANPPPLMALKKAPSFLPLRCITTTCAASLRKDFKKTAHASELLCNLLSDCSVFFQNTRGGRLQSLLQKLGGIYGFSLYTSYPLTLHLLFRPLSPPPPQLLIDFFRTCCTFYCYKISQALGHLLIKFNTNKMLVYKKK